MSARAVAGAVARHDDDPVASAAQRAPAQPAREGDAPAALEDAYGLLESRALIVPDPKSGRTFCRVSRAGRQHLAAAMPDGKRVSFAARALDGLTLHPALQRRHIDTHFLQGKYETALRDGATFVEDAIRQLGGYSSGDIGVNLVSKALARQGPLTDPAEHPGQQTGLQRLFEGFFGSVRNLIAHTGYRYDDGKGGVPVTYAARPPGRQPRRCGQTPRDDPALSSLALPFLG